MFKVTLTRGNHSQVYGTYATQAEADAMADAHRECGYWTVEVSAV